MAVGTCATSFGVGQSLGDCALRRSRLVRCPAGSAGVFRTANPQDAERRRDPIEHLADGFTDQVQRPAAAGADAGFDVDHDLAARKVLRKPPGVLRFDGRARRLNIGGRQALFDSRDIGVKILQFDYQLIGVEPFGTPAEPHALQVTNDGSQAFDLSRRFVKPAAIRFERRRQIAHESLQH